MRQEGQAFVFPISQSLAEGHPLRGRAGSVSCVISGPESQKLGDGSSTLKKGFGLEHHSIYQTPLEICNVY